MTTPRNQLPPRAIYTRILSHLTKNVHPDTDAIIDYLNNPSTPDRILQYIHLLKECSKAVKSLSHQLEQWEIEDKYLSQLSTKIKEQLDVITQTIAQKYPTPDQGLTLFLSAIQQPAEDNDFDFILNFYQNMRNLVATNLSNLQKAKANNTLLEKDNERLVYFTNKSLFLETLKPEVTKLTQLLGARKIMLKTGKKDENTQLFRSNIRTLKSFIIDLKTRYLQNALLERHHSSISWSIMKSHLYLLKKEDLTLGNELEDFITPFYNNIPAAAECDFSLLSLSATEKIPTADQETAHNDDSPILIKRISSFAVPKFSIYGCIKGEWQETDLSKLLTTEQKEILAKLSFEQSLIKRNNFPVIIPLIPIFKKGHTFDSYENSFYMESAVLRSPIEDDKIEWNPVSNVSSSTKPIASVSDHLIKARIKPSFNDPSTTISAPSSMPSPLFTSTPSPNIDTNFTLSSPPQDITSSTSLTSAPIPLTMPTNPPEIKNHSSRQVNPSSTVSTPPLTPTTPSKKEGLFSFADHLKALNKKKTATPSSTSSSSPVTLSSMPSTPISTFTLSPSVDVQSSFTLSNAVNISTSSTTNSMISTSVSIPSSSSDLPSTLITLSSPDTNKEITTIPALNTTSNTDTLTSASISPTIPADDNHSSLSPKNTSTESTRDKKPSSPSINHADHQTPEKTAQRKSDKKKSDPTRVNKQMKTTTPHVLGHFAKLTDSFTLKMTPPSSRYQKKYKKNHSCFQYNSTSSQVTSSKIKHCSRLFRKQKTSLPKSSPLSTKTPTHVK